MKLKTLKAIALDVATESKCVSMKVGAVLVKDGHIVSTGYNGTAKGDVNCCDKFHERGPEHSAWSDKYEIHAESNAMFYCPVAIRGSIMVCTHSPCWNCTKHMIAAGVTGIYFAERYYRMTDDEYNEVLDYCIRMKVTYEKVPE